MTERLDIFPGVPGLVAAMETVDPQLSVERIDGIVGIEGACKEAIDRDYLEVSNRGIVTVTDAGKGIYGQHRDIDYLRTILCADAADFTTEPESWIEEQPNGDLYFGSEH